MSGTAKRAQCLLSVGLACIFLASGCSIDQMHIKFWSKKPAAPASANDEQTRAPEPAQENSFSVHIEYAERRDFLRSLTVIEYQRAQLLMAKPGSGNHARSLVRFSGGTTIWRIEPKPVKRTLLARASPFSVLSDIPVANVNGDLRVSTVGYGKVPRGFIQAMPQAGPPDPLEIGEYYMVRVERAFGVTNYQLVRLDANGDIEVYDADPRAGDSYELCCDVSSGFFTLPSVNQEEQRHAGDEDTGASEKPANDGDKQIEPAGPASR
jgi:hypothetical protein